MTIELITKNKVADYIKKNPEAATYLMTWLKESKYLQRRYLDTSAPDGIAICQSQLGASNYIIKLKVNLHHKTGYILFFGTREEERVFDDKAFEGYNATHPQAKIERVVKTVTVTVKAPNPDEIFKQLKTSFPIYQTDLNTNLSTGEEYAFPKYSYDSTLISAEDYEQAFERAEIIFNALPDTDEFKELTLLLSQIKNYESANFKFPKFNALEAIKLRMRDFSMSSKYFIYNIDMGTEEDITLFLSGKKLLPDISIEMIYKQLGLKLTVNLDDFVME